MIVTCPSCSAKYRVKDDQVPDDGAELECPECKTHFLAQRPKTADTQVVVDKLRDAKNILEERVKEKTRENTTLQKEAEAARTTLDAQRAHVEAARLQIESLRQDASREIRARDVEIARLSAELDVAQAEILRMASIKGDADREIARLLSSTEQLKMMAEKANAAAWPSTDATPVATTDPDMLALVNSVSPMLWGLERALAYLEPFAKSEAELEKHVRQLLLLKALLTRISEKTK